MIQLLRLKEFFYRFVGQYEIYVLAAVRFVIAFAAFRMINVTTGYMKPLSDYPIALILALLCSFLPSGLMIFFGMALILIQFYALSLELCLVTAMIFVVLFCVYLRFSTKKGIYAVITPVLSVLGIPYAVPVTCGLIHEPYTVISVICGEVAYFILKHVNASSALFSNGSNTSAKSLITIATTQIFTDKEMYLYLGAFAIAAILVYCIRRLSTDHAHLIGIVLGIVAQLVIICAGEIIFGNGDKIVGIMIGCIISLVIALVISFMTRSLDYSRVERVQFEDDEYYYYVKAVPKSFLSAQDKQVKSITGKQLNEKLILHRKHRNGEEDPVSEAVEDSIEAQLIRELQEEDK